MFNTIITFAVLNSFFSPSVLYYNRIAPVNSHLNTVQSSVERCKSFTTPEQYTTSYKLSSLGNQLYKVSTSDAVSPVLKFAYNSESGAQVQSTPTVYLNARDEAKLIIGGLPESSFLAAHYKCHSKDLKNSSLFDYKFDFQNLGNLQLTPEKYSYQKDVTTDTCQNLIESTPELGNEIVLNKWVLSQNYCYSIDESNLMLNLAVMPELALPEPTTTGLAPSKGALSRLLKPAVTENTYQLKIDELKTNAKSQITEIMSDAKTQKSQLTLKAVMLTVGASHNEKIAAQDIDMKMNMVKANMNLRIASMTSGSQTNSSWNDSSEHIDMLLRDEFNQLQVLKDQLAVAKEQEKNQINELWIEKTLMGHEIDAAAYEKVIQVREKSASQIAAVQAEEKAHDAQVAAAKAAEEVAEQKAAAVAAAKLAAQQAAQEKAAEAKQAAEQAAQEKAAAAAKKSAAEKAAEAKAAKPVTPPPTKPVSPAPAKSVTPAPAEAVTPAPAKPVTSAPVKPAVASTEVPKPAPLEA